MLYNNKIKLQNFSKLYTLSICHVYYHCIINLFVKINYIINLLYNAKNDNIIVKLFIDYLNNFSSYLYICIFFISYIF